MVPATADAIKNPPSSFIYGIQYTATCNIEAWRRFHKKISASNKNKRIYLNQLTDSWMLIRNTNLEFILNLFLDRFLSGSKLIL